MPKPNKKRIEDNPRNENRPQGTGKLYIPDPLTAKPIGTAEIDVRTTSDCTISDDELERELRKLLSGQQGYGKNFRNAQKSREKEK